MIALYRNDPGVSVAILAEALEDSKDPWYAVTAALLSEQQGWMDKRDEILSRAITLYPELQNPSDNRANLRRFIDMYVKVNSEGLTPELAEDFVIYSAEHTHEAFNVDAHAFAGELLRLKGQGDFAKTIFSNIISVQYRQRLIEFIPYQGLSALGEDPVAILDKKRQ